MEPKPCHRCGGSRVEPGALFSPGVPGSFSLAFRPANTKFLTMQSSHVAVESIMCLDCGLIEIIGDTRKAQSLMPDRANPH